MLVTIEGISGSGKTKLIRNMKPYLEVADPIYSREPYGTMRQNIIGNQGGIKKQGLYYILSHAEHLEKLIEPKNADNLIIVDEFFDSIIAHQTVIHGQDINNMVEYMEKSSVIPDITFLLDCPGETAHRHNKMHEIYDSVLFYESVRENYLLLAQMYPERYIVIDTQKVSMSLAAKDIADIILLKFK